MLRIRPCALVLAATSLACAGPEPPPEPGEIRSTIVPGVELRGAVSLTSDDHLVELLVHEDHVYAANSWRGIGVMALEPDGGLTLRDHGTEKSEDLRCTTLAVHPRSNSLYCGADTPRNTEPRTPAVERLSLDDPDHPARRERFELEHWSVSDLLVVGDNLLIHQYDDGLWLADIGPDGRLEHLRKLEVRGNARHSVQVGDRVVTSFAEPDSLGTELRVIDPATWTAVSTLELPGPPLGLSADADGQARVAVGLGSAGMAIVTLGPDGLSLERTLAPEAVVTHGLVAGDLAVAVTLSGAFAYALDRGPEPRMFGFAPEGSAGNRRNGNMLHGVLHDGELIASDWTWVERWHLDPDGEVVDLDVPRGVLANIGGPIRFALRNPGHQPLRAELWHGRLHVLDVDLDGGAREVVELSPSVHDQLGNTSPVLTLGLRVHDPEVPSEGVPVSISSFVVVHRQPGKPLPPAVGDPFPPLVLADREHAPLHLPLEDGTFAVWFTADCALMWPEVEDLAWLERSGGGLGRGTPVILSDTDLVLDGFARRRGLDGLTLGLWGAGAPPEIQLENAVYGEPLYESFFVPELPGDAVIMDYEIDTEGRVRSVERMYRGRHSLAVPGPWDES